jgi:hypothetical protein
VLLYNLARAYEGLGDSAHAVDAYATYLTEAPAAPDRGAIEERIRTLRREIAEREKLEHQRQEAVEHVKEERMKRTAPAPPRRPSAVPWTIAAAGGLVLATGTVVAVLAKSAHDAARDEPVQLTADTKQRDAMRLATWANVCFVTGGVAALAGVGWGILNRRASAKGSGATAMHLVLGTGSVAVSGRF